VLVAALGVGATLFSGIGPTAAAATTGLVAAYSFNEGSGARVGDSSGNGNNGTGVNGVWTTTGKFGGSLLFNGTDARVTVPDSASLDLTNGMTIEAWIRPTVVSGWQTIATKETSGDITYGLFSNSDTNRPSGIVNVAGEKDTRGASQLPLNTWTHLATTYDGSVIRVFVNGTQVSSRTVGGNMLTSTGVLRIGGNAVWGEYFNGYIDELRIYKRALSVAEVQSDMNTAIGSTAPPATQVGISISPTSASLQTGATRQFTASVTGTTNTAVTWSATGGTVSSTGVYTAPSTTGTYTVRATSVADTTKSSSATVSVTSGSTSTTYLLGVSPTSLSYGNVVVGNSSSKTVTLTNTGTGSVQVTAANFTGGVFTASGLSLPFTLAPGGTRVVTVVFRPDVSGPFSGSVSFVSNATNSPARVTLSGSGTAPTAHSVDMTWNRSTSNVSGYYVYRGTSSAGPFSKLNSSSVPNTTYTDSTVQSGRTYYYVVTAVDSAGRESAYSNVATAVVPTP
jgi:hypothetical protein